MTDRRTALEIQNLSVRYEENWILRNLSFNVAAGEFVSLLGPSGAGKSTVLKTIVGEVPVSAGAVHGPNRIAYAPQRAPLLPWLTIMENLELTRLPNEPRDDFRIRAKSMLDRTGLGSSQDVKAHKLSGGMRSRASVARAFLIIESQPDILLMDEPFIGLDAVTRDLLHDLVLQLWARAKPATLFVTHDIDEAIKLSNRILVLGRDGSKFLLDMKNSSNAPNLELRATIYEALK